MSIRIFYDETDFRLKGFKNAVNMIKEVIAKEGKISGDLNFIITTDEILKKINLEFLEHDYYTDVITFDYSDGNVIKGEIYISLDRVIENALNYNVSFKMEMMRVFIHGILHLLGYDDIKEKDKAEMRRTEDYWLMSVRE